MSSPVQRHPLRAPDSGDLRDLVPLALRPRAAEVLREVVDAYLRSGEPVGSHVIAEHAAGHMSAATARVVLSELADQGLLSQPHTSAGRVPTERGLRVYVSALMRARPPSPRARGEIDAVLRGAGPLPNDIVRAASEHLAERCELAALARRPRVDALRIEGLRLVAIGGGRVLAVAIFTDAVVRHRVLESDASPAELERVQNLFAETLAGLTVAEARDPLHGECEAGLDARTRALGEQALPEADPPDEAVFVCGRTHIVDRAPNPEQLGDMLRVLDDKRRLRDLLDALVGADGVQVLLGDDAAAHGLRVCSVVAAPYFVGASPGGTVGIVGPLRMEYARVIPLVTYTARAISGILRGADAA